MMLRGGCHKRDSPECHEVSHNPCRISWLRKSDPGLNTEHIYTY
jgi:hypothetical protein